MGRDLAVGEGGTWLRWGGEGLGCGGGRDLAMWGEGGTWLHGERFGCRGRDLAEGVGRDLADRGGVGDVQCFLRQGWDGMKLDWRGWKTHL